MATTALSTLQPLMTLPRCPDAVQFRALRRACHRFCRLTEIWREDLAAILTVADQEDYICSVAYTDTFFLRAYKVTVDSVEKCEDDWSFSTAGVLSLDPAPVTADKDIIVSVVYIPSTECTDVVDWLVTRWGPGIAAGAEAELKADPGGGRQPVPWYNPESAALAASVFSQHVGEAKAELLNERRSGYVGVNQQRFYL